MHFSSSFWFSIISIELNQLLEFVKIGKRIHKNFDFKAKKFIISDDSDLIQYKNNTSFQMKQSKISFKAIVMCSI